MVDQVGLAGSQQVCALLGWGGVVGAHCCRRRTARMAPQLTSLLWLAAGPKRNSARGRAGGPTRERGPWQLLARRAHWLDLGLGAVRAAPLTSGRLSLDSGLINDRSCLADTVTMICKQS